MKEKDEIANIRSREREAAGKLLGISQIPRKEEWYLEKLDKPVTRIEQLVGLQQLVDTMRDNEVCRFGE